jgi:hypothetical protein
MIPPNLPFVNCHRASSFPPYIFLFLRNTGIIGDGIIILKIPDQEGGNPI